MKFIGDIIITDPCYITKKNDETNKPTIYDFVSYFARPEFYPDAKDIKLKDYLKPFECFKDDVKDMLTQQYYDRKRKGLLKKVSKTYNEELQNYEKALKEWEENNVSDWEKTNYGEDFLILGFSNYLSDDTGCGDWSCITINEKTDEEIGEFCADTGMVGVFLLDEVLKYNPDFDYHINKPWTTTLVKNFNGDIEFEKDKYGIVRIVGKGNIDFYTEIIV